MPEARPTTAELLKYFLYLGSLGFGGPVALVGYMQRDLVEKRQWFTKQEYMKSLALAQLAPGPLAPPAWMKRSAPACFVVAVTPGLLAEIMWFFTKAGAFVFGSGLAIVPFLYGGVVKEYGWLNDQQFVDAVAVAMITPGPVVITVGFIGFLIAGFAGACVAALATFLPCYLFTVIPAPYFRKYGKRPGLAAFVEGVTAAAIGAISGAVIVLGGRTLFDADWNMDLFKLAIMIGT